MKINTTEMQAIEDAYKKRRREDLWDRFKSSYPNMSQNISDKNGIQTIHNCIEDGKPLNIVEDQDVLRFSALAYLPNEILQDDWYSSILIRILNNITVSAAERLDNIFFNVIDTQYIS